MKLNMSSNVHRICVLLFINDNLHYSSLFYLETKIFNFVALCWFQTSLPLAALPLRRLTIAWCFRVAALSGNAALALSPSGIASELNRIQLSAICRGGQSGKVIDLLAWRCLPLGHPSAASGACAVVQKSPSKRQCGKRQASLKAALKLHVLLMYQITVLEHLFHPISKLVLD